MIVLDADGVRAVIDPAAGGRLASLRVAGSELLVTDVTGPMSWGSFPMAPWAGRVRRGTFSFAGVAHHLEPTLPPHAAHGTTHLRPWRVTGQGRIETELGSGWPFPGHAVQVAELHADHLVLVLEVHADEGPMPASCGWHPWFRRRLDRGGAVELDLRPGRMYRRDAEGIPTGELVAASAPPWDDCFVELDAPPRLRWPGALELEIRSTASHWVVYTEPDHALCVEPQTGPPDALNLAPTVVEPGRPLVATMVLAWWPATT